MDLHTPLHSNIAPVCICISVVIFTIHAADSNCPMVECFVCKVVLMYNTDMFLMKTFQLNLLPLNQLLLFSHMNGHVTSDKWNLSKEPLYHVCTL